MLDTRDRHQARLATLSAIGRALARPLDERAALRGVHAELERALDASMCFFGRYDAASQSVEVTWQTHDGVELPGGHFPLGRGPTSQAILNCRPVLISNWSRKAPPPQVQYATQRTAAPESCIVVPVVFDGQVTGVLSVQSYAPDAYDAEDVALLQSVADLMAIRCEPGRASDLETVFASMGDALVVLDTDGRAVRLNQAARRLLGQVILGYPVDRPQADNWPLGSEALTAQLRPVVDQLRRGIAPSEPIDVYVDAERVSCTASVLVKDDQPCGAVMLFHQLAAQR